MRMRWMTAVAAALAMSGAAAAQPAKQPTVEVRLRSVNDLIGKAEYLAALAGKEEVITQARAIIKQLTADGKGLEGIDTKRPFGLTATLSTDVVNSPFTLMIPIADQERFLTLLRERLQIAPEKAGDGTYKAAVPVINEAYLRFADDYAYVTRSAKDLDPKVLAAPKTFFAKDDGSVASVLVRVDTIPAELRTFAVGQLEHFLAEEFKKNAEGKSAAEKAILDFLANNVTGGVKTFLEDAKDLNVRVFIDEKTDELSAEATLSAKPGSTLAKNVAALGGPSLPAGIVAAADPAVRLSAKAALPAEAKKDFGAVVDKLFADMLSKAKPSEKELVKRLTEVASPTLKAGEMDAAGALLGPDAKGRHTLIGAGAVKKGREIEKLLKDIAPFLGEAADIELDVEKVGAFALHKVTFKSVPPEFEKLFGSKVLWLAFSEDHVVFSLEPEGAAIRAGLKARPVTAPAFTAEIALARLIPLINPELQPDELKALLKDAFGDGSPAGKDTITVSVTGGSVLTVKGKMKGKAVRLGMTLDQFKVK